MLIYRILSAVVLIPVVGVLIYLGGGWFLALVMVVVTIAGYEYLHLMHRSGFRPPYPLGLAFLWLLLLDAYCPSWGLLRPGVSFLLLASLVWILFQPRSPSPAADWALTLAGPLYLGWVAGHFILLRNMEQGLSWLILALPTTWITDSGAYFVGLAWGRHKLWPRYSPKKTWEGAIGGLVSGVIGGALIAWLLPDLRLIDGLVVGTLIPLLTPFGDFAISMMKRQAGVKDSSHIIPGHGGFLDRLDTLLFAVVIVYYYAVWVTS